MSTIEHNGQTFTDWLAAHQADRSAIGDLARDVAADPDWPAVDDPVVLTDYLASVDACPGALTALHDAWQSYASERRRANR